MLFLKICQVLKFGVMSVHLEVLLVIRDLLVTELKAIKDIQVFKDLLVMGLRDLQVMGLKDLQVYKDILVFRVFRDIKV